MRISYKDVYAQIPRVRRRLALGSAHTLKLCAYRCYYAGDGRKHYASKRLSRSRLSVI
jgi:hypothetical protein